ncbi:hypothetical protein BT93_H0038 [Corymbia citriodora subsp. variegata]|nr:hypothetical protein BT93_H0038 [Corymbia citriodora subsp. variegata]
MENQHCSSDKRKNKNDDKEEATLPMDSSRTDEMSVPICPHSQGEEKKRRQSPHSIENTFSDFDLKGGSTLNHFGSRACPHSDVETGGTHSSGLAQAGPALVLSGDSSSHRFTIETESTRAAGQVQGELRLVLSGDSSSTGDIEIGDTHSSNRVSMVDPLLSVIVQGACSLVAYKKSEGFSLAKNVLLYVLVFVYVLGFVSALGAKLFTRYKKLGVIALVAAALAFLMTMALVVI